MQTITINGNIREDLGKKATKANRKNGQIPCVIYGGKENIFFTATNNDFSGLVYTPDFKIAEINIGGKVTKAIMKEIQFHPVTDRILHIDFVELIPNQIVKVEIPIKLTGKAIGATKGGVVSQKLRRVLAKTTPECLVGSVEIDITNLDLGQSARVREITQIEGIEIMNTGVTPVATLEVPRAVRSAGALAEQGAEEETAEAEEA